MSVRDEISFQRLSPEWEQPLVEFFVALSCSGGDRSFHPHPFDAVEAQRRASYTGNDEYHVATDDKTIVAYGMLRGWDEGYEIPSLGIAVHPEWQGRGLGRRMMVHLHEVATTRGANRVRLQGIPRQSNRDPPLRKPWVRLYGQ